MMRKIFCIITGVILFFQAYSQIFDPVRWNIVPEAAQADEITLTFTAVIERGWHLYDTDLPKGGPVSTSVSFETLRGAVLIGKLTASVAPVAKFDEAFKMELRSFDGTVTFLQKLRITDPAILRLEGEIEYMACDDKRCLPPERKSFAFNKAHLPASVVAAARSATDSSSLAAAVDSGMAGGEVDDFATANDQPLEPLAAELRPAGVASAPGGNYWEPVVDELKAFGDVHLSSVDLSLLHIFLAGLAGGAIALLTPCVWPMIPMTVSFFLKRSGGRRRAIRDAAVFGLSIIIIYVGMGLALTLALGANALNNMATNYLNVLFGLLLIVFAASFFGAFELTLPASWTTRLDRKADRTSGWLSMFFMAFTLALVSFSCTGPIIGTLLVQAASMGGIGKPAVGMFGFALALAAPFALFAVFPNLLRNMPKSGGWLNSVKVTLGFLELALALKFFSVADLAYGWRLLDREVFLSLWIVIFALLGIYLLGKIRFAHDGEAKPLSVTRLFLAMASLSFAVYMVPGLWGAPLKAISAFAPPLYTQDLNLYDKEVHAAYDDYDFGMEYARHVKKPVVIDFSGFGCVNCRKMETAVWTDPQVKSLLERDYVLITLFVDDKTRLPAPIRITEHGQTRTLKTTGDKWSYLQRSKFGANAQPFYVLLDNEGLPLNPSYAFSEDIAAFRKFLNNGLNIYKSK